MGEKKLKDIKKKIPKSSYQNRGLKFEERIQHKCDELRKNKVALLSKVPTEWMGESSPPHSNCQIG